MTCLNMTYYRSVVFIAKVETLAQFAAEAQIVATHNKIMLTRIRLPVKNAFHKYNLWLEQNFKAAL